MAFMQEGLLGIDECWTAARFDSLPHVVHILTSKDREGEIQFLREQSDRVEDVVDEVVHAYHHGFNKAIQNYSQILRLFSESAESISVLKGDMAKAKEYLSSRNKQLGQLWYRSLTLRHILSLLDQVEGVAKVPARIEKLMAELQLYAAIQLHAQSMLMLEREGLQVVNALQDVRSELTKLRGVLFYKILEELHNHLYNKGVYSLDTLNVLKGDEIPTTSVTGYASSGTQPLSRRTRSMKGDSHLNGSASSDGLYKGSSGDGGSSFDGHDENSSVSMRDSDAKTISREVPAWLSHATPDEFIEAMTKSDSPVGVKYLCTLIECLSMLGKVAAAGAIICQRLRPTMHDIISSKVKAYSEQNFLKSQKGNMSKTASFGVYSSTGHQKNKSEASLLGTELIVSPISPTMTPTGSAQCAASELLNSVLDSIVHVLENHIIVGEFLEAKSSQGDITNVAKSSAAEASWNPDSESSQVTGGYSVAFSLSVIQSECQQLLCEVLRATPEAATADAALQTARLANKAPVKEKRNGSEGLSFAFRITDSSVSMPNDVQAAGQGWRKGSNVQHEGYGSANVLPELGTYLAASVYRPVLQFTDKIGSLLPPKYSQLGNSSLLAFMENFLKDHFLPTIFVDYRKCVQQAISSPAAFRPRGHATSLYSPEIGTGRPVLQGLLAVDILLREVLGWVQLMPKYATELVEYVRTFLDRTHERCRKSYMEAVLEKQSYMLLGRSDIENLMRRDPANSLLQSSSAQFSLDNDVVPDVEGVEMEIELNELLLNLRPIKQETLIHDDQKLILLASLSDSLEYLADSVERLGESFLVPIATVNDSHQAQHHRRTFSTVPKGLESLATDCRRLAVDCLKVLRLEMQLETIYHIQEMTKREYLEDQDSEEPDDFIISLIAQITHRDDEMAPFVAPMRRRYIFGGIPSTAASASIKALGEIKNINLLGVQQICRNSIALEQALVVMPSVDAEAAQQRLDRVRTFYELLNMPFESLLAFMAEHEYLFSSKEYSNLLKVNVTGRVIPADAERRVSEIMGH